MSGSAHPTTSADIAARLRQEARTFDDSDPASSLMDEGADVIDALAARLAVWEQLRPDELVELVDRSEHDGHISVTFETQGIVRWAAHTATKAAITRTLKEQP